MSAFLKEIARMLFISYHTVKSHLQHIKTRLNISSIAEAIHIATIKGWIDENNIQRIIQLRCT
ncbi:MAG: response regulator transcription factor [Francisellaceae bacterium]